MTTTWNCFTFLIGIMKKKAVSWFIKCWVGKMDCCLWCVNDINFHLATNWRLKMTNECKFSVWIEKLYFHLFYLQFEAESRLWCIVGKSFKSFFPSRRENTFETKLLRHMLDLGLRSNWIELAMGKWAWKLKGRWTILRKELSIEWNKFQDCSVLNGVCDTSFCFIG